MDPTMNNTQSTADLAAKPRLRRLNGVRPQLLPQSLFVAGLLERSLPHIAQDSFRGVSTGAKLAELGQPILVRADPKGDEVEALLRLPDGSIALIDGGHSHVTVEVAAATRQAADDAVRRLRRVLAKTEPRPERVSFAFWMKGEFGGDVRHRAIEAPAFDEIADNYSAPVRASLQRLIDLRAPERGRLILWRGDPGTGKSHALRALARAWAPWCSAHFIMDPEELLGRGGGYMLDVLSWDGDEGEDRWRLVVLEDAGELIAADARAVTGQALSRLLNVADGILGQGTRTLLLITTNEPVKRLHPAARRPGRCLADLEFTAFSTAEANVWLAAHGHQRRVDRPAPLAELFGHVAGDRDDGELEPEEPGFGFARALVRSREPLRSGQEVRPLDHG
jgi:hypothetical protein